MVVIVGSDVETGVVSNICGHVVCKEVYGGLKSINIRRITSLVR